jgi:tryptophan-rich sensory protein
MKRDAWVAAGLAFATASIGGGLTVLDDWYYALVQPAWKPPDWLFGPAWTLLFGLMAWSGVIAWRASETQPAQTRQRLLGLWALNALLNIGWSLLFFKLQKPTLAVIEVTLLWGSIILLIWHLRPYAQKAAWLLWPYLAWVSFAGLLNAAVVRLN